MTEHYELNTTRASAEKDPKRVAAGKRSQRTVLYRSTFDDLCRAHAAVHPELKQSTIRYQVIDYLERFIGMEDPEICMTIEDIVEARDYALIECRDQDIDTLAREEPDRSLPKVRSKAEKRPRSARSEPRPAPEPEVRIQWADEDEPAGPVTPRRLRP